MRPLALKWRVSILVAVGLVTAITVVSILAYHETHELQLRQTDQALTAAGIGVAGLLDDPQPQLSQTRLIVATAGVAKRRAFFYRIWCDDAQYPPLAAGLAPTDVVVLNRVMSGQKSPFGERPIHFNLDVGDEPCRAVWLRTQTRLGATNIVLGHSFRSSLRELNELLGNLLVAGAGVVVCSIVLVTLLVAWGLGPIGRTARQLVSVTASNVGQVRLDGQAAPSELRPFLESISDLLARLDASLRRQKAFVSDASHELRTPLASAKSTLQLALSKEREAGQYRQALQDVLADLRRMERLADEILILARMDEQQGSVQRGAVSLDGLLKPLAESFAPQAGGRIVCDAGPLAVWGNREQLERLFGNLLDNAIKYGPAGGTVTVSAQAAGGLVSASVHDQGGKIPPEMIPVLFDRFVRLEGSRSRSTGGAGLGLSIAREIATRHGGSIEISSSPAAGTTVLVKLPVAQAGGAPLSTRGGSGDRPR